MDIEEDLKILQEFTELDRKLRNYKVESDYDNFCERRCVAIDHILAEREEDKKKIKELKQYKQMYLDEIDKITDTVLLYNKVLKEIKYLKENNNKLKKYCKEIIKDKQELTSDLLDSIPKQKVKDKIEEMEKEAETNFNWQDKIYYTIGEFKKLLEDK